MHVMSKLSLIFMMLSAMLNAADNHKEPLKEHRLDDERLQHLLTTHPMMLTIESFLNRCNNQKLTCEQIILSLADQKPLQITRKSYFDLIHITYGQIQDLIDGQCLWGDTLGHGSLQGLRAYLCDGCNHQTVTQIKSYYGPLIIWVSQQLLGTTLPVEICKKILSNIDINTNPLPDCVPYKIFKTDALIMLRYASQAYPMPDYKAHYKLAPALDALW